jgi:hypothetical protein
MADDLRRYTEYQQSQMLTPGWEEVFDGERMREWYEANGARLAETLQQGLPVNSEEIERYRQAVLAVEPATLYDDPHSRLIFEPLMKRIKEAADELGRFPIRPVLFATSTDTSPTPSALPTGGDHQLYIGPGTAHFCNYWAKAIAAVAIHLPAGRNGPRPPRRRDLEEAMRQDASGLKLAIKLLWAFGETGSTVGVGSVVQPPKCLGLRIDLLRAMELFVVGHEYAHFIAHEHAPKDSQPTSTSESHQLELACDVIGLNVSRQACSRKERDWLGYCGAGAIVFFRAIETSERARELFKVGVKKDPSDHPPVEARIGVIKAAVRSHTPYEQRKKVIMTLNFYDVLGRELGRLALEMLSKSRGTVK